MILLFTAILFIFFVLISNNIFGRNSHRILQYSDLEYENPINMEILASQYSSYDEFITFHPEFIGTIDPILFKNLNYSHIENIASQYSSYEDFIFDYPQFETKIDPIFFTNFNTDLNNINIEDKINYEKNFYDLTDDIDSEDF